MADSEPSVGDNGPSRSRSGPGRLLRDQRLRRELSVGDVADGLHLDAATIDALERDDYARLPPVTFVRGYLRAYARLLELPDEEILRRFQALGVEDSRRPLAASAGDSGVRPASAPPGRRRSIGAVVTVSLGLVLLVGGVGGGAWLLQQRDWSLPVLERLLDGEPAAGEGGSQPLAAGPEDGPPQADATADGGSPAAPDAAAPLTGSGGAPAAAGPDSGAGAPAPAGEAPAFDPGRAEAPAAADAADTEADAVAGAPQPADAGGTAAGGETDTPARSDAEIVVEATRRFALAPAASDPEPAVTAPDPAEAPPAPQAAEAPADDGSPQASASEPAAAGGPAQAADPVPGAAAETLRFRFSGESWMEVRDARGERLLFGLEDSGERVVEGVPPFEIVIGDTENVALEREGEPVALADYARDRVARFTLGSP